MRLNTKTGEEMGIGLEVPDASEAVWFTQRSGVTIGIVKVRLIDGGVTFRIGNAVGLYKSKDAVLIAERGAPFPYNAGITLLGE